MSSNRQGTPCALARGVRSPCRVPTLATLAILAAVATPVAAQPSTVAPAWQRPRYVVDTRTPDSYTTQIAAADALALVLLLAGGRAEGQDGEDTETSELFTTAGIVGAFAISPLVHLAHGHGRRAGASFALRATLSFGGMLASIHANRGSCEALFCEFEDMGEWFVGGLVVASIADLLLFSHGDLLATRRLRPAPTWTPTLGATPGGAQVGVVGSW